MADIRKLQEQGSIGLANFGNSPQSIQRINAERQFMKACFDSDVEQVKASLRAGVNAGAILSGLTTPFQIACAKGLDNEILKEMLYKGAEINHVNQIHFTALHMAAMNGKADTCRFLVQQGASKDRKTINGQTAADLAQKHGFGQELV